MRPLRDLASKMVNATSAENTPTSSNPEPDQPAVIRCFDPQDASRPCPLCRGMGLLLYDVPPGDANFGKAYPCPHRPVDTARVDKLRRLGNLDDLAARTLENFQFSPSGYRPHETNSLTEAWRRAVNYANQPAGWLLFEGRYGTGKTHLAAAIGNARLAQGDSVIFMTTPDLLDHLRNSYSAHSEIAYDDLFDRLREVTLLILDDLGAENPSEWAMEKLFQLLNHRYTAARATIITTNTPLERLDGRISSRLRDTNVVARVVINAPDYRDISTASTAQILNGLSPYHAMTFDTFDVHAGVTAEESANLRNALRAAQDFTRVGGWLILLGGFGAGKTHLAAAIANHTQQTNGEVTFVTTADLLDFLKSTFSPDAPRNFEELFDTVRNVPLLVLDDLSFSGSRTWATEKLFQLLDYRYVRRLPTVITTAHTMEDMERTFPRIVSRLLDTRLCRVVGLNVRSYPLRLRQR